MLSLELPTVRAHTPHSTEALWQPTDGLCSTHPSIATCLPSSSPLLPPLYLINTAHSSWLFPYRSTIPCMGKGINAVKGRHLLGDFSLRLLSERVLFLLDNKNLWLKELLGIGNVIKCSLCPTSAELTNSPLAVTGLMGKEALLKSSGYFCIAK